MEDLLEFLFGASGRVNRAKYWRSLLILGVAGMFVGVILLTAAGIASPLFIIMVIIVFIPWLMWGIAIHTERLHDRDKSAWWLVVFYGLPAALSGLAEAAWVAGLAGPVMHSILGALSWASFALTIWGFVEICCLRGTAGPNRYGANPLLQTKQRGLTARRTG
jgi:uncharacterized membrane protein YhaH (DUF805 family)